MGARVNADWHQHGLLRRLSPTGWVAFQSVAQQGFSILIFAIQAPLLGPHPFGVVSLVMVLVGFCEFVLVAAVSDALISVVDIEHEHFHSMNLVNLLLALLAGVLFLAGADAFAAAFQDPQLAKVLRVMSVLPLISALAAAPTAAAKREMHFQLTAVRTIAGVICGGVVGLALTLTGFGVWALVWQAIVQRLVATVTLWMTVPLPFSLRWSGRHFREVHHYAAAISLSRTMNWASAQAPRLVLGLFLGTTDVGLFSMAARLNDILTQIALEPRVTVARVELRRYADDIAALRQVTLRMLRQLSAFCFPLFIGGAALVPALFHAWLDPHWYAGIVPAQLLMLMGVPAVSMYLSTAILLATRHQHTELKISTAQTLSVLLAAALAAPLGLIAASLALALRPLGMVPLPLALVERRCGIPARQIAMAQAPALAASVLMAGGVVLLGGWLGHYCNGVYLLTMLGMFGAVSYAGMMWWMLPEAGAAVMARLGGRA